MMTDLAEDQAKDQYFTTALEAARATVDSAVNAHCERLERGDLVAKEAAAYRAKRVREAWETIERAIRSREPVRAAAWASADALNRARSQTGFPEVKLSFGGPAWTDSVALFTEDDSDGT